MGQHLRRVAGLFAIVFALSACEPLISPFSADAYKNATSLKARSLAMVRKSSTSYAQSASAAEALMVDIDAAYEFAAGRPRNDVSSKQWDLMRDPSGNLMGGFMAFWERRGTMGEAFRGEYAKQIAEAYDTIICVEATKKAPEDC